MAFRARKNYVLLGGWSSLESVDEIDETGRSRSVRFNPHREKLPPIEQFELDTLLKAGVPLQQTRTKILAPDASVIADALAAAEESDFKQVLETNQQ